MIHQGVLRGRSSNALRALAIFIRYIMGGHVNIDFIKREAPKMKNITKLIKYAQRYE
jgi:hypothetical protein